MVVQQCRVRNTGLECKCAFSHPIHIVQVWSYLNSLSYSTNYLLICRSKYIQLQPYQTVS